MTCWPFFKSDFFIKEVLDQLFVVILGNFDLKSYRRKKNIYKEGRYQDVSYARLEQPRQIPFSNFSWIQALKVFP